MGEALNEVQAAAIARQGVTKVVILAGPSGSGKTTILTSLFEGFLQAPFGNFLFAGSQTLVGFERRCHDARIASERELPHTVHTPVDSSAFLHLKLAMPSGSLIGPQNLLLADVSGERFRALRDSTDAVRNMGMLRRADHLCIVIDGEKLVDPNQRNLARTDARMLLRCILAEDVLAPTCQVEVVFSKWDLVIGHVNRGIALSFADETKRVLQQAAGTTSLHFFDVAARPEAESPRVSFAFGLPTLLHSWMDEPLFPERPKLYMPARRSEIDHVNFVAKSVVEGQHLGEVYDVEWV
jgi:energy-coupling factor transporter ATP-binding protein EcfA2